MKQKNSTTSSRICLFPSCNISASFGYVTHRPLYCKTHCDKNMFNVRMDRCSICKKFAAYGPPTEKHGTRCSIHKTDDMVNISNNKGLCLVCKTKALYGYASGKRLYCFQHKKENMINFQYVCTRTKSNIQQKKYDKFILLCYAANNLHQITDLHKLSEICFMQLT